MVKYIFSKMEMALLQDLIAIGGRCGEETDESGDSSKMILFSSFGVSVVYAPERFSFAGNAIARVLRSSLSQCVVLRGPEHKRTR